VDALCGSAVLDRRCQVAVACGGAAGPIGPRFDTLR